MPSYPGSRNTTSNGTTSRPANRCRMASWRASTADCVTSASTSTCSPTSRKPSRSSKNGGSTTTPTDHTRASTGSHQLSLQPALTRGKTGTDSPYERGQIGEQVTGSVLKLREHVTSSPHGSDLAAPAPRTNGGSAGRQPEGR